VPIILGRERLDAHTVAYLGATIIEALRMM
jgi:hypothetical protein